MASTNEPADPVAKGIIPTAKQSLGDLFKWKQRVVVTNDFGESRCEWQKPTPLQNPITLLAQLSARDVWMDPQNHMLSILLTCLVVIFRLRFSSLDC
jgi:hypothetical protein